MNDYVTVWPYSRLYGARQTSWILIQGLPSLHMKAALVYVASGITKLPSVVYTFIACNLLCALYFAASLSALGSGSLTRRTFPD